VCDERGGDSGGRAAGAGDVQGQQGWARRTAIRAARRISIWPSGVPGQRDHGPFPVLPAVVDLATVEAHLSRVYAKLGVASRTQLARRLGAPA